MPENQTAMPPPDSKDDGAISLLDLLVALSKRKKMIAGITFAVALVAALLSLRAPNIYTATVRILPPQQSQSTANAFLSQLGGFAGMAGGRLGIRNPEDLYIAMLKSRNVIERVVRRFDLQKVYGAKSMTVAIGRLTGSVSAISGKDGIISVAVDDKDPKLAADMANAIVEELDNAMQTFSLTDASHRRRFFEQQMKDVKDKLTDAETQLERTRNTSMQYLDAMRNLKYQESVYEILSKQYEIAKLDEAKDYPLIQVLDKAEVPETKSRPKRMSIVAMAAVSAFVLSIFLAFFMEILERQGKDPQQRERLARLKKNLSIR